MTTAPSPRTWVDGESPGWETLGEIGDTIYWLLAPPMVKLHQTSAQSIPDSTNTAVTFNVEEVDAYGFHSTTTNPTRITPTIPGWYRGWMSCGFSDGVTTGNYRLVMLGKNGTLERSRRDNRPIVTAGQTRSPHGVPFFVACNGTTDYVEMYVYQDSGAARTLGTTASIYPEFFMRWWGPL